MNKKIIISSLVLLLSVGAVGCSSNTGSKDDSSKAKVEEKSDAAKSSEGESYEPAPKFPDFVGKDSDGKEYTNSIFADKDVTVINFWSKDCPPCVDEMPELDRLNKEWSKENITLIGIPTVVGEGSLKDETDKFFKKMGVSYANIYLDDQSANEILTQLMYTPTTVVVNKKGEIVGDVIPGAITSKQTMDLLNKNIELAKESSK